MDKSVYQVYEDEIQSLEEEIKLLAEKYEDIQQESSFFSDEEVRKSKYVFCITGHSKKTLEKTANRTVATHSVSGKCRFLSFCLEFQLTEMQNMYNVSASITDLSIAMESGQQSELSKLVSSIVVLGFDGYTRN
ncbi:UNVERIFIED_CONTAM: hypothetical protein H355_007880 [Colinus virginianus]|nr:hypothetical protein H355_007880 [Colinus virginianus]